MNPIFSRRYKAGSRPNIMHTSKRQNILKSLSGSSGGGSSSSLSSSTGVLASLNLSNEEDESPSDPYLKSPMALSPSSEQPSKLSFPKRTKAALQGQHRFGQGHQDRGDGNTGGIVNGDTSRRFAQQLLASKQNMLAQLSLTPHENRQRSKVSPPHELSSMERGNGVALSGMRHSVSSENFGTGRGATNNGVTRSPTVHNIGGDMTFCDLEDDHDHRPLNSHIDYTSTSSGNFTPASAFPLHQSRISRPNLNQRISKEPLDMKTWRELKRVVCGTGSFHEGWIGQGFTFDTNIPFGLVQKNGGPCGVLAVVQSLLIRNLLFGSSFEPNDGEKSMKLEEIRNFLENGKSEGDGESGGSGWERIKKERVQALVDAVAEIIWACAQQRRSEELPSGTDPQQAVSVFMFSDYRIQPETIRVCGRLELQHFLENSIHRFDCISLVYSAVLTRGITGVKTDLDFENCSLVGQHGYCSQELINLLSLGRAISNTFDHEIELDGKVLKGITGPCDIGLLSLFEHYDSIKVGSFLKCPRFPVWIVCSESHFSVLFSCDLSLCDRKNAGGSQEVVAGPISSFDLFYYDGLARQDKVIRLSIYVNKFHQRDYNHESSQSNSTFSLSTSSGIGGDSDDELVPPLEKCIRTKWRGAQVDWNDTEPIL